MALRWAQLHAPNRLSDRDALIAATALVHRMSVVARNAVDFEASKVAIVDPWRE